MEQNAYSTPRAMQQSSALPIKGPGWSQAIGIMNIIGGAFMCLGIITIPIGLPFIFSGLAMFKGGESARMYSNSGDASYSDEAVRQFVKAFRIQGIVTVVMIGLYVGIVVAIVFIGAGAGIIESLQK